MKSWLVRLILAVLALEAGVCVAFLADDWGPLREKEEMIFTHLLTSSREGEDFVLDDSQPISRVRLVRPLVQGNIQSYFHIKVDEQSAEELDYPLEPENWWGLLNHIHEVGCEVAAIEEPLSWEGEDVHHLGRLGTLDTALSQFETAVLTVDLKRLPKGDPLPDYLRRSTIPLANVRGELADLVKVNHVLLPPSATPADNIRFSFRVQESAEKYKPEIVRWGDHLIPSFPLAVAMAQAKVSPHEVKIELGRHIRLGDGPIIPIDEIGALRMDLIANPRRAEILAQDAVLSRQVPQTRKAIGSENIPRCALFTYGGSENPSPWNSNGHLQKIISSFDVLPRPGGVETLQRLNVPGELALLALVAFIAALLASLPGVWRHLTFLVFTVLLVALILALFVTSQKWTPVAPVLATIVVGWVLATRMKRYLPARKPAVATAE